MIIRPAQVGDIPGMVALQRACFPEPFPEDFLWKPNHLEAHLDKFPEGQFVAEVDGVLAGSASNCRIGLGNYRRHASWEDTLGGWTFEAFDAEGAVLYGADISVHPSFRRQGIARALYAARFELIRQGGAEFYATACRLPGFLASGHETAHTYVQAVVAGRAVDATLTPLLRMDLQAITCLENYMEDEESGNAACLLEWRP